MEKVIAIFDIGKTNKKMLLFNEKLELVFQHEEKFPTTVDDDNFECDPVDLIVAWINTSLETIIEKGKYNLTAVNFSTYGATLVFAGADGKIAAPLYNYLKPMPHGITEPIYENFGGVEEFCRCTASPALGMLNSGFQILWLKKQKPQVYENVKHIMHFPQYLSYCFTGKITSEYTSIGCHTALWNFDSKTYHPWLLSEGIQLPLPMLNDILFNISFAGKKISVGIGIHDSSASLVPYLQSSREQFILISTGTWSIFMNPFNEEPLTNEQLNKDALCYISTLRQQVKSSRLFMGHFHDIYLYQMADYFMVSQNFYKDIKANEQIVKKLMRQNKGKSVFFKHGIPENNVAEIIDLTAFSGLDEAYHQLVIDLTYLAFDTLQLVIPKNDQTKSIYISGGFAQNEIFVRLLSALVPEKHIFTSEINNATALGAAITIHKNAFNGMQPDLNLGLQEIKAFDLTI